MKITRKDLLAWIREKETIRYRGELYKAHYNGLRYWLQPLYGTEPINFYPKGRGIYGLETNKTS